MADHEEFGQSVRSSIMDEKDKENESPAQDKKSRSNKNILIIKLNRLYSGYHHWNSIIYNSQRQ